MSQDDQPRRDQPLPQPEPTPITPAQPIAPQPTQPFYSPSQPGSPKPPDYIPGPEPYYYDVNGKPKQPQPIPTEPGYPNPETQPGQQPTQAPAPVAIPDPGAPRVVAPDGQVDPVPGGGVAHETPRHVKRPSHIPEGSHDDPEDP